MILENIKTSNGVYNIKAKTLDEKIMDSNPCFISVNSSLISLNGRAIKLENKIKKSEIEHFLASNPSHVCVFESIFNDGTFVFSIHGFAGNTLDFDKTEVLVSPNDLEKFKKYSINFKVNGNNHFIIQTYTQNEDNLNNNDFSIIGDRKIIDVEKIQLSGGLQFKAIRIRPVKEKRALSNYVLVKGQIVFGDKVEAINDYKKKQLECINRSGKGYLDAWKKYTEERGNILLNKARKIGKISFERSKDKGASKTKIFLDAPSEIVKQLSGESISVYAKKCSEPVFLQDKECSWNDYLIKLDDLQKEEKQEKRGNGQVIDRNSDEEVCDFLDIKTEGDNCLVLETEDNRKIPEKGFITLSLMGEKKQIERQTKAWNSIFKGETGINHLALLLEAQAILPESLHQSSEVKIGSNVWNKIFPKNPPTQNQIDAIQMALRTPDIALIQGPPGTGKTTVIAAILEQLNIMQDKSAVSAGRVLATSYQHDAVENMIGRLRVNSLPTFKFGSRKGEKYTEHIEEWTQKLVRKVIEKNPELQTNKNEHSINTSLVEYKLHPTTINAITLLEVVQNCSETSKGDCYKLQRIKNRIENANENIYLEDNSVFDTIISLRVTKEAFLDDGKDRALDLYTVLDEIAYFDENSEVKTILRRACINKEKDDLDALLSQLKKAKEELLEEFRKRPFYALDEVDNEIVSIAEKTLKSIQDRFSKKSKREQILYEWKALLENNSSVLTNSIKDLDFVFASSVQQSVGLDIGKYKYSVSNNSFYDTVVIDEAARATPPDLLIPMQLANRRIILVGDHRQLPQLVDDEICKTLENKFSDENFSTEEPTQEVKDFINSKGFDKNIYELSLFEVLFKRLKELEKNDGIKRTITLNAQYRTHPVLGRFASDHFYKEYGEEYSSPRNACEFAHSLCGIENKAAVWIDVPLSKGYEKRMGTSWTRAAESEIIIQKLKEFVLIDEGKKLSYGIITFYSGQEELIRSSLKKEKLSLKSGQLKIGTVDAFQGMEFDVVFLSVVRANKKDHYGFLCSKNRLCVSMTRQKKLLICVGSKDFCASENARRDENIPALADFYDLCKNNEYGAIL